MRSRACPAMVRAPTLLVACGLLAALAGGCGSSGAPHHAAARPSTAASSSGAGGASSGGGAGALSAEAKSVATGDIPDNQAFLTYKNATGGYAMSYPEGWAIQARGADVTISDKNNIVRVLIGNGGPPSASSLTAELARLKRSSPTLSFTAPTAIGVKSGPAVKASYSTSSAPNPVTGKQVLLLVDRYELGKGPKLATVDLGTPKGVDNVDAYRMMINSFRWL